MKIVQREFRREDLPHLKEFKKQSMGISFPGKELDEAKFERRLLACAAKYPEWIRVLDKEGEVIGYIWFGCSHGDTGRYGFLHQLFIKENYRKSGLARQLLDYTEDYLRARGVRRMELKVTETNIPALNLYEKMNYRRTRFVMEKKL